MSSGKEPCIIDNTHKKHTHSPALQMAVCVRQMEGVLWLINTSSARSDCIIIILMTAVFSLLMAFQMNKTTPEVSKSSPLLGGQSGVT